MLSYVVSEFCYVCTNKYVYVLTFMIIKYSYHLFPNEIIFFLQVASTRTRLTRVQSPQESRSNRLQGKQRRDSGGRDSGIEPSPRVSRIPRRRIMKCCPNTDKQQTLNMDTVTRDVQITLRRYHLERKIFFQLMELKRLQIRHGRANEQVLIKRQVTRLENNIARYNDIIYLI